jgi:hypothetical protein
VQSVHSARLCTCNTSAASSQTTLSTHPTAAISLGFHTHSHITARPGGLHTLTHADYGVTSSLCQGATAPGPACTLLHCSSQLLAGTPGALRSPHSPAQSVVVRAVAPSTLLTIALQVGVLLVNQLKGGGCWRRWRPAPAPWGPARLLRPLVLLLLLLLFFRR